MYLCAELSTQALVACGALACRLTAQISPDRAAGLGQHIRFGWQH